MALENAKRLLEHFKSIGKVEEANQILEAYPELEEKKPVKKEDKKE